MKLEVRISLRLSTKLILDFTQGSCVTRFFSTLALVNMLFGVFLHKSAKYRAESRQIDLNLY